MHSRQTACTGPSGRQPSPDMSQG